MLTEKDYCDYDTCVALNDLGFSMLDDPFQFFISPTQIRKVLLYEAQKWLREEKEINISPIYLFTDWGCIIKTPTYGDLIESHSSYEEALSEGIKKAIKILKDSCKQSLESENTEYDYGHNVYHEEL